MRIVRSNTLKNRISQHKRQSHHRRNRAQQHLLLLDPTSTPLLSHSSALTLKSPISMHSNSHYSTEYILRANHCD